MPIRLTAEDGLDRGKVYDVTGRGTFVFGREGEGDVAGELPSDPYCSRRHAHFEVAGPLVLVADLASRNGTWVNGRRIEPETPVELRSGDRVKIGRTVLRLDVVADLEPSPSRPAPAPSASVTPSPTPAPIASPAALPESLAAPSASPPAPSPLAAPSPIPSPPPIPPPPTPAAPVAPAVAEPPPSSLPPRTRPARGGTETVHITPRAGPAPAAPSSPSSAAPPTSGGADDPTVLVAAARTAQAAAASPGASAPGPSADSTPATPAAAAGPRAEAHPPRRPLSDFARGLKLGGGGGGVVYRATDRVTGGTVALKLLQPRRDLPPDAIQLFLREIAVHASLSHPHIVPVVTFGEDGGKPWLVLAYVDGPDLERHVEDAGPLAVDVARRVGVQLCGALAHAHGRGVVHRDVKPSNVLLAGPPPWTAHLADFGVAKALEGVGAASWTQTHVLRGTPAYAAPEQLEDAKRAGPAADQYGLAATLYFALTRTSHLVGPLEGYPGVGSVLRAERVPLRTRRADVPEALAAAVDRALSRAPADRFPSVQAFGDALRG